MSLRSIFTRVTRHIWTFISLPFRKIGAWFRRMALVPKICLILAVMSVWGFSQLKTEPIQLSVPSFTFPHLALNSIWLIILSSAAILILVIILMTKGRKRKAYSKTASQPTDTALQSTGSSRAWKPEFPKIPSPGFDSRDFYTIVAALLIVLCLYLGFQK